MESSSKTEADKTPEQHHQDRTTDNAHGDQYRPAFLLVERKPLEPLRQEQEDLHHQQPDEEPIRREVLPAVVGLGGGHGWVNGLFRSPADMVYFAVRQRLLELRYAFLRNVRIEEI